MRHRPYPPIQIRLGRLALVTGRCVGLVTGCLLFSCRVGRGRRTEGVVFNGFSPNRGGGFRTKRRVVLR